MPRNDDIGVDDITKHMEDGARLIDVRETDEYESGHVPGAENWPLSSLTSDFATIGAASNLLVICRSGGRSANACEFLSQKGFTVTNVDGGTMAWAMAGRDLVEGASPK
ncbi:MAG: hypothetical protein RL391_654 [Actinomycetota bacterium]|jgi:rhodanese-related sulfurtransferase